MAGHAKSCNRTETERNGRSERSASPRPYRRGGGAGNPPPTLPAQPVGILLFTMEM
jgi:hypothetical protein